MKRIIDNIKLTDEQKKLLAISVKFGSFIAKTAEQENLSMDEVLKMVNRITSSLITKGE